MDVLLRAVAAITIGSFTLACTSIAGEFQKVRDLSLYDLAGPYSLDRSARHAEDQPVFESAIREFLWTRWQRRRLAHLSVVQYSLEGLPTRTWYFVEPDQHGVWQILVEQDVTLPALNPNSEEHRRETHRYEAYSLDRVEAQNANAGSPPPIPDKEKRASEEYQLRLKNERGEVIYQL